MRSSKIIKIFYVMMAYLFLSACITTSYFRVGKRLGFRQEALTTPDRINLVCEKVSDENELYMFYIPVLDDKNTVTIFAQTNTLDRESCEIRITIINHILATGKHIFIGAMGDLLEPEKQNSEFYTFSKKGTYPSNGRHLQFLVIANEKGQCFGAYYGSDKPCPRDEFPIP